MKITEEVALHSLETLKNYSEPTRRQYKKIVDIAFIRLEQYIKKARVVEQTGHRQGVDEPEVINEGDVWIYKTHRNVEGTVKTEENTVSNQDLVQARNIYESILRDGRETTNMREFAEALYKRGTPTAEEYDDIDSYTDAFNGGTMRSKAYFPLYYYPTKILQSLGFVDYKGRTVTLKPALLQ